MMMPMVTSTRPTGTPTRTDARALGVKNGPARSSGNPHLPSCVFPC
jgi:hypothetical protein